MRIVFNQVKLLITYFILGVVYISCGRNENERGKLFSKVPYSRTNINFINKIEETESLNILEYLSTYNGGGVGAGDFNNDGLIDLYFTANQQANKLYINKGDFLFEDVTEKSGVAGPSGMKTWTNGVTVADINGDGWLDIYICQMHGYLGLDGKNLLYINNADGTFSEKAKEYQLNISAYSQHAAFFDYDKDGDLDMYLLNQAVHTAESYMPSSERQIRDTLAGDRLLQNSQGKFTDVSEKAGIYGGSMGYGLSVSTGDVNNDGWTDIYVTNDFHENDYLYYNQGDGIFKENIIGSMGHVSTSSMGNDIGDYNNDGYLDIITLDMKPSDETILKQSSGVDPYHIYQFKLKYGYHYQFFRNMLQRNMGNLFGGIEVQFSEVGQLEGISDTDWSWSAIMADLDNDGLNDIFITNGIPRRPINLDYIKYVSDEPQKADSTASLELIAMMPEGKVANVAFRNLGHKFDDVSTDWGLGWIGHSNGAVCTDLDNDGDLDLVVNNLNAKVAVFKNHTSQKTEKNFLKIAFSENGKRHTGIGVRIELIIPGITQLKEVKSTSGWLSSSVGSLIFGLDTTSQVINVKVTWPGGKEQLIRNPVINSELVVKYEDAELPVLTTKNREESTFKNITYESGIDFHHRENYFVDFAIETLIPHFLSTQGPKIAVGDVNSDGIDDFFIGGSKQQAGKLYLGSKAKQTYFDAGKNAVFEEHKAREDVGVEFADVDNDGDLDLYLVSGGAEPEKWGIVQDRLYLNDGTGRFTYMEDALPDLKYNGSCVVSMDVNFDGFVDFFVGGRSTPQEYGIAGVSKFLINNGNGTFQDETRKYLGEGERIGMVTDAAWIHETNELVVVGEWMPIGVFKFTEKSATYDFIPNSAGWWNTVLVEDLDDDGDMDFLVGNEGLNTNISASPEQPLDLYVSDYDGNLSIDPIMVYYKNGKQWVYPGLDELANQIVNVKRTYKEYKTYANQTFSEVFPSEQLERSLHRQVQTLASVLVEKTGDGYEVHQLPLKAQVAPIFGFAVNDFNEDGIKDILAVGNFYDNQPVMGKSDASYGTFLQGVGGLNYEYIEPSKSGFAVYGEARDVKFLEDSDMNKMVLVSRNNNTTRLFSCSIETK